MIPKLIEAIVRSLPAGECLDSYILLHRPAPDGIGSLPGDELLDQLKRERSLYWAELYAATTPLPEQFLGTPAAKGMRVKRALGRNPFLDDEHRVTLLEEAAALGDRPLIIATLSGSTDPLRLLVNSPQLIAALSAREGQPGMGALMRALRVASPESITQLAALLEGSGLDDALRRAVRERVFTARTTYFRLVSADREQPRSSEHLGALCSLGKSFTKLELPVEFRVLLEEASSPTLLRILDCFTMNDGFYRRSASRGDLFNRASSFDLAAAMRVELDRHHLEWCRAAYQAVGGFVATNIGKHQHLETFTRLLPEWRGSLAELLTSASTL